MTRVPLVVSFGGGVNTGGMLCGMYERGIRPDVIPFADTGNGDTEKPETYAWIDQMSTVTQKWWGVPVSRVQNDGVYGSLLDECIARNTLPSLAFGWKSCSDKYKRRPIHKYLKSEGIAECRMAIGIDAGEPHRVGSFDEPGITYWHPLIEWGWRREECVAAMERHGVPVPPKSACFFCPASKKSEVIWLKNTHPLLYERAVLMERNANLDTIKGLGRHWSWEEIGQADDAQFKMFPETTEMPCMCFDGDDA